MTTCLPRFRLRRAARVIREGGVVAYPTEAVYGLGCDPRNGSAVLRLLALKRRPVEKGLILIGADLEHIRPYLAEVPAAMLERAMATWPGPATWLFPAGADVPLWLRGAHSTIAVRITAHPLAAALCRVAGQALVSTSANLGGHSPLRSARQVRRVFRNELDYLLHGAVGSAAQPTQIRDAASGVLIRP